MDHEEVDRYWNDNAETWTKLARAGYDTYRDAFNTPAFFALLPDIHGLVGLDIGCSEGYNTRLLAQRGARITAIDIAETFIASAQQAEADKPLGIEYRIASAVALPFPDQSFDFATGFMSFMDIPETDRVVAEAYRVLKLGGFLQFSILHPCFLTPHCRNVRNEHGRIYAVEVGDYFRATDGEIEEWYFSALPPHLRVGVPKFKTLRFSRTLSQWINLLIDAGFQLERLEEPRPSDDAVCAYPDVQDAQVTAFFCTPGHGNRVEADGQACWKIHSLIAIVLESGHYPSTTWVFTDVQFA